MIPLWHWHSSGNLVSKYTQYQVQKMKCEIVDETICHLYHMSTTERYLLLCIVLNYARYRFMFCQFEHDCKFEKSTFRYDTI